MYILIESGDGSGAILLWPILCVSGYIIYQTVDMSVFLIISGYGAGGPYAVYYPVCIRITMVQADIVVDVPIDFGSGV